MASTLGSGSSLVSTSIWFSSATSTTSLTAASSFTSSWTSTGASDTKAMLSSVETASSGVETVVVVVVVVSFLTESFFAKMLNLGLALFRRLFFFSGLAISFEI